MVASSQERDGVATERRLPANIAFTILVASYPLPGGAADIQATTNWLEAAGFRVYYSPIDAGSSGRWQRVLAGAYTEASAADLDVDRLRATAPNLDPRVVRLEFIGIGRDGDVAREEGRAP
jgi:hypothetical protein